MARTVVCVVGTRPEAIKIAPVVVKLREMGEEVACRLVGTGQHREMLDGALAEFGLKTDRDLHLLKPGQLLAEITAKAITGLSEEWRIDRPDLLLAVGDTTTVFAAALSAYYERIPFGHIEAGLRTGDPYRPFPEEKNRELAARLAAIHFAPTADARGNLLCEGIEEAKIVVTGNPVIDALRIALRDRPTETVRPPGDRYILVTAHRRENWGEPMRRIAGALKDLLDGDGTLGLLVPVHPNRQAREALEEAIGDHPRARIVDPMGHRAFVWAMADASLVLTDSGGVQEEAPSLGRPVLVLRESTERPEAMAGGMTSLVGTDRSAIVAGARRWLSSPIVPAGFRDDSPFGDGRASERIARSVREFLGLGAGPAVAPWPPVD